MLKLSDQASGLRDMVRPDVPGEVRCRRIAFVSGKSGVGKSQVALNLGVYLAGQGERVVLVDAAPPVPGAVSLAARAGARKRADREVSRLLGPGWVTHEGPWGLRILAPVPEPDRSRSARRTWAWRLKTALAGVARDWDLILLDLSGGRGTAELSVTEGVTETILVTTPDPEGFTEGYALLKTLWDADRDRRIRILLNRAGSEEGGYTAALGFASVGERFLGRQIEVLGVLPRDLSLVRTGEKREPVILENPHSPFSAGIRRIAQRMKDPSQTSPDSRPKATAPEFGPGMPYYE